MLHAKYWLLIYDYLRDSTTTLLPTKLHDLNKRCRQGRQQMIKSDTGEYEIIGIKLCLNINVVVFSDGDIPKWKTITKPMYNYTCTSCEMSNIVQCNFGYCNQKIFNQSNNFANRDPVLFLVNNCFAALNWAYLIYNIFLFQLSQISKSLTLYILDYLIN